MRITSRNLDDLLDRCKRVEMTKWEVANPVYVRSFPFSGFSVLFRRRTKELTELEKKHIELFEQDRRNAMENQNERLIAMLKEIIEYRKKAGASGFQLDKLDDKLYKAEVLLDEIEQEEEEKE